MTLAWGCREEDVVERVGVTSKGFQKVVIGARVNEVRALRVNPRGGRRVLLARLLVSQSLHSA